MKFIKTSLIDLYIIEFEPIQDKRGKFYRVFCKEESNKLETKKKSFRLITQ